MADSSPPVNQPITAPSESTHANQTLQNQVSSSPQLPPPQNLNHQLSGGAESIIQLIASLPPEPNSALFPAGVPYLESTQSNPSPPKQGPFSIINFRPELPSLSQSTGPGLGSLINECMMILKQRSGSQPAALNVNNQVPYAGSESSIQQQIACQLLPQECNSPGQFLLEVVLQAISQSPQLLDNISPLISMVQALLHPAYNPDRVLPPAPAYGLALNQADSNHERNPPQSTTIDIDGPRSLLPNSSTVNAAPNYQPPPSVFPPVTQYQVSDPMVAPPSFGNQPTVIQSQSQDMKETQQSPVPPPRQSVQPPPQPRGASTTHVSRRKNVAERAANLANLLPTGTVLAFQSIVPSLSNTGRCDIFNRYLIGFFIAICAATCFFSSFTDSFEYNEKLYYGFATCNGLCVFNYENRVEEEPNISKELEKYKVEVRDFIHAFGSFFVFLIFAISSSEVLSCFFPQAGENDKYSVVVYLPLVAGVLSSFLFSIFPTKRKGFGSADYSKVRRQ